MITKEQHILRHKELHERLDELVADYIECTGKRISETTLLEFIEWSFHQTFNPTIPDNLRSEILKTLGIDDKNEVEEYIYIRPIKEEQI